MAEQDVFKEACAKNGLSGTTEEVDLWATAVLWAREQMREKLALEEQRIADLMADLNRTGHELDHLRGLLREALAKLGDYREVDFVSCEATNRLIRRIQEELGEG